MYVRKGAEINMCNWDSVQQLGNHIGNKCTRGWFDVFSVILGKLVMQKTTRWPTSLVIYHGKHCFLL